MSGVALFCHDSFASNDKIKEDKKPKAAIVFFSRPGMNYWHGGTKELQKGNTARMAGMIRKATNADVYEIVPQVPYPFNYRETTEVAQKEKTQDARPQIKNAIPDLSQYEVVFLGHPIWWSDMPMIMRTFLDQAHLEGKKIAHFCTHEGSGFGSSDRDLRMRAKNVEFLKPLAVAGTEVDDSEEEIRNWAEKQLQLGE